MGDAQTPTPQMIFLPPAKPYESPLPMIQLWAALTGAQKPAQKPAGGFVGIGYARSSAEAQESVERTREALARNIGNPTEQDWRDALQRAEARATDRR